jgi:hypothetical protein
MGVMEEAGRWDREGGMKGKVSTSGIPRVRLKSFFPIGGGVCVCVCPG